MFAPLSSMVQEWGLSPNQQCLCCTIHSIHGVTSHLLEEVLDKLVYLHLEIKYNVSVYRHSACQKSMAHNKFTHFIKQQSLI